jgi:hypothetical protein
VKSTNQLYLLLKSLEFLFAMMHVQLAAVALLGLSFFSIRLATVTLPDMEREFDFLLAQMEVLFSIESTQVLLIMVFAVGKASLQAMASGLSLQCLLVELYATWSSQSRVSGEHVFRMVKHQSTHYVYLLDCPRKLPSVVDF